MNMLKKLHLDIVSDIACPWCYIGMQRLEKAIANVRDTIQVTHRWVPFELFPTIPSGGIERTRHMVSLFGSHTKMKRVFDHVKEVGHSEGIELNFDRILTSMNTFDLHRLLWKAEQHQQQDQVAKAFFAAFFTEGINLAEANNIATVMKRVGWASDRTMDFLNSQEGTVEVMSERKKNLSRNVTAIPHYIINNQYSLVGAQSVEAFEDFFRRMSALHASQLSVTQ